MNLPRSLTRPLHALWPADRHIRLLVVVVLVVGVLLSVLKQGIFLSGRNFGSMALQVSDLGILTLAMMIALVIGGIDLSVSAVANLAGVMAAVAMHGMSGASGALTTVVGVAVALAVGLVCGLVNGILIGYIGVPAILATLATLTLFTGIATVLSGGGSLYGFPDQLTTMGSTAVVRVPVPTLILAVAAVAVWVLLNRTAFGTKMYLLGANPKASLFSGVRNGRVVLVTHAGASLLAALAGIVVMARTNSASPSYGSSYVLVTILIVVLGGVAVTGGSGRVSGVVLALVALQMLSTGFNMLLVGLGNSNFFTDFAWGALLLLVVAASAARSTQRRRPAHAPPAGELPPAISAAEPAAADAQAEGGS
jgi:simple sugar transport system permease protein